MGKKSAGKRFKDERKIKKRSPPTTKRWCVICEAETQFKYDFVLGHSRCKNCGCGFANQKNPYTGQVVK